MNQANSGVEIQREAPSNALPRPGTVSPFGLFGGVPRYCRGLVGLTPLGAAGSVVRQAGFRGAGVRACWTGLKRDSGKLEKTFFCCREVFNRVF
jgi:hypothetical protein